MALRKRSTGPKKQYAIDINAMLVRDMTGILNITPQTLHNVPAWKNIPRNPDGTFPMPAVFQWRVAMLIEQSTRDLQRQLAKAAVASEDGESTALERRREAQAKLSEIDLAERLGNVVDRRTLEVQLSEAMGILRDRLMFASQGLAPKLVGLTTHEIGNELDWYAETTLRGIEEAFLAQSLVSKPLEPEQLSLPEPDELDNPVPKRGRPKGSKNSQSSKVKRKINQ